MSDVIVEVRDLGKTYWRVKHRPGILGSFRNLITREYVQVEAVKQVNFQIQTGEIIGYIGPNGAGKSTTVKMLCGILVPTVGSVQSMGLVPYQDRMKYVFHIGVVMGQRTQLWWDLAVIESFNLLAKIYRVPNQQLNETLEQLDSFLQIKELLPVQVRKLSLGQRMRCDLVASMLHRPKLLFLDEPTIGLDVVAKSKIREFLKKINKEWKTTILLTTHDLADIEEVCPRILILDRGTLVYDGDLPRLFEKMGSRQEINTVLKEGQTLEQIQAKITLFPKPESRELRYEDPLHFSILYDARQIEKTELIRFLLEHFVISDLKILDPSIEEVIKRIYQRGETVSSSL